MAKYKFALNPLTGRFDLVNGTSGTQFNVDTIITHKYTDTGNELALLDPFSGSYSKLGYLVVTDEEGNVIST